MSAAVDVREEERRARERLRLAARAARAKRAKRDAEVWAAVRAYRRGRRCRCELRAGMDRDELRELGSGCCSRWVCPVLDFYRRRLGA